MPTDVFYRSAVLHLACFRNVVISHTGGLLRLPEMKKIGDAYRDVLKRHPQGVVAFVVLAQGTPVAEREALQESPRFMSGLRDSILCASVVMEEGGAMAQLLNTVIRGINVVTRRKSLIVFTTHEDALRATAPHVVKQSSGEETTALLKQAVAEARGNWQTLRA